MKLISQYQQAKFELMVQSVASALLSTIVVAAVIVTTSPYSFHLASRALGA